MTEPLVALPGTLCTPAVFDPIAARLGDRVEVDAVSWLTAPGPWDIPAVAASIAAHIRRTYGGPVLVCGHSTGGAIALQLAVTEPELVRGLLLVDTGAHMRGHGDVNAILRKIEDAWGEALWASVLDRSFHTPPPADVRAAMLEWVRQVDPQAAHDVLVSQRDLDLGPRLREIRVPTVVVHGRYDPTRTIAQAEELADAIPGARLRIVDAGHTPVFESPDEVAAAVRELLEPVGRSTL